MMPGRRHRFLLFLCAIGFSGFLIPDVPAEDTGNRVVVLGVYENSPKVFTDPTGKPSGIFIDILESIAEAEGWKLRYQAGTWAEGLDRLERGDIDLMPDVAYSAFRDEIFDFHAEPVLSDWFQVYARKGSGIHSIVDLDKKRVVVLDRSVQQAAFEQIAGGFGFEITLIPLPDYTAMFELVAAGEADAAVTNRFYGAEHVKKYSMDDTAVIFNPTRLYYAAPEGQNETLLRAVDEHLDRMKKNPRSVYYQSLERWTSEKRKFTPPAWMKITGTIVLVVLAVSLSGSVILKRKVDRRTSELLAANRDMEKRIHERTNELAEAMERAQEADHIKSAFLATMSHELRTPLNSIIGFTGILLQGLAGPLNEEQQKQLRMVQNSSRHLLALINDVLDISKIEAGQLTLSFSTFPPRSSVEKAVALVLPAAEKKGITLQVDMNGDLEEIRTDQRRLEQIILNLLTNAIKFTDSGYVRLACRKEKGFFRLSVSDTGIGISPEDIPTLFQPFHQIDGGTQRKHEGTGLGLSICKKLIHMMGGTIEVESRWGKGSTFAIQLPLHPEEVA